MNFGFTFNGVHCNFYGVAMRSKNRQVLPATNDTYLQIPARQGTYLFCRELADRTIELNCALVQNTLESLRARMRQIATWLYTTDRQALSFDDEPAVYYMAKLDDAVDLDQVYTVGEFMLRFRCEPFAYGAEQQASFVADAVIVTNSGTFEALPVFNATFTAAAAEWKVTLDTKYIRVVNAFVAGDTLEVNCVTGAVLINGARAMDKLDWQNSDFFALAIGSNALTITPAGKCTATIKWVPRYL